MDKFGLSSPRIKAYFLHNVPLFARCDNLPCEREEDKYGTNLIFLTDLPAFPRKINHFLM